MGTIWKEVKLTTTLRRSVGGRIMEIMQQEMKQVCLVGEGAGDVLTSVLSIPLSFNKYLLSAYYVPCTVLDREKRGK